MVDGGGGCGCERLGAMGSIKQCQKIVAGFEHAPRSCFIHSSIFFPPTGQSIFFKLIRLQVNKITQFGSQKLNKPISDVSISFLENLLGKNKTSGS